MIGGTLLLDGFQYKVIDRDLPKMDELTLQPTGEVVQARVLVMETDQFHVEVQLTRDEMVELGGKLMSGDIQVVAAMPRINGARPPG